MNDDLFARLRWQYGVERASEIVDGLDEATERDLAAWNALGGDTPADPLTTSALRIARGVLKDLRNPT